MLISDIRNELARELSLRKTVFPRLISAGRLTKGESDERMDRLDAALRLMNGFISDGYRQTVDVSERHSRLEDNNTAFGQAQALNIIKAGV
jgi:hypothetical protein